MKIGIFGVYNHSSIGDHAILAGIFRQFEIHVESPRFVVFSPAPDVTKERITFKSNVQVIKGVPTLLRDKERQLPLHEAKCSSHYEKSLKQWIKQNLYQLPGFAQEIYYVMRDIATVGKIAFWKQIQEEIRSLDVLLIGGGNLIMDLFRTWPIYPLIYVALAKQVKVPVMFYAVGAGPLHTRIGRFYLRIATQMANKITFRDQSSLNLTATTLRLQHKHLILSADPATCLRVEDLSINSYKSSSGRKNGKRQRIAMTLVSYYRPGYWPRPSLALYKKYREAMIRTAQHLLKEMDAELVFFVTNTADIPITKEVVVALNAPKRVHFFEEPLLVPEILSLLANCDLMIGTRLHSLILSFVASTPALAFSYHPKVTDFYQQAKMESYVLDVNHYLTAPSPQKVVSLLEKLYSQKESIQAQMQHTITHLCTEAKISTSIAIKLAKQKKVLSL